MAAKPRRWHSPGSSLGNPSCVSAFSGRPPIRQPSSGLIRIRAKSSNFGVTGRSAPRVRKTPSKAAPAWLVKSDGYQGQHEDTKTILFRYRGRVMLKRFCKTNSYSIAYARLLKFTRILIRSVPDIETSLAAGVQYTDIIKVLAGIGFELSPRAFGSALYRARQRKAEKGQ